MMRQNLRHPPTPADAFRRHRSRPQISWLPISTRKAHPHITETEPQDSPATLSEKNQSCGAFSVNATPVDGRRNFCQVDEARCLPSFMADESPQTVAELAKTHHRLAPSRRRS